MLKFYVILLCVFTGAQSTISQITVHSGSFPDGSDILRYSVSGDLSVDYSITGSNIFWDFSALQPNTQKEIEYLPASALSGLSTYIFGSLAPTNYETTMFHKSEDIPLDQIAAFLPLPIEDFLGYKRKTAESLTAIGYSLSIQGNSIPFRSDTIETHYHFPMTYNSGYSSRGYTNVDLNPIMDAKWKQYRQRYTEVDGYGTLTTPFGTFNVLRLHHEIHESDSLYYGAIGQWIPITLPVSHHYEWISDTEKGPLLKIQTTEIAGNEQVTQVEYRDHYVLATPELSSKDFFTFGPNPVNEEITVVSQLNEGELTIESMDGKIVYTRQITESGKFTISMSDLSAGSYLIKLQSNEKFALQKLVKN